MELSILLMEQIAKLFIMIFMGYAVVKMGLLKDEDSKVLSTLVLYLIVPCVILNAFQVDYTPEKVSGLELACIASLLLLFILLSIVNLIGKVLHLNEVETMSIYYSNSGNLIVPLVAFMLGDKWVFYACVFMGLQTIFFWTHCKKVLSHEKGFNLKKIFFNINIITIIIAITLFFAKIRLPEIITGTLSSVGAMIGPASMFVIGMLIGGIFAYKANVLNIALEGMMLNGAFISVLVEYLTGSVALAVIAAIVTTLLWGLVFSFLGITCNGNVIVIGLGINLIVPAIAKFVLKVMELANISLQDVGVADFKINIPGIKSIPLIGGIVSGHPVITYLAFIGIAAAAILMYKTKFGIYVRVVGENEDSAISLGLKTQKYKYIAVLIGAFCCALAGINLSMERMAMFTSDMTAGRGFIAIAAIYCGQGKPVQSSLYAILFGVARSLAVNLSVYAGPAAGMFDTIPYIIMVAVLAVVSFMKFKDVKVRGYKFD